MKLATSAATLTLLVTLPPQILAQQPTEAERLVEAYFQGQNYAASQAAFTCPGDDAVSDEVMRLLSRPRSEAETSRLLSSWGGAAPCRVEQLLEWYVGAARVIRSDIDAGRLARRVLSLDPENGADIMRAAAADASVGSEARGAYQLGVYYKLGIDEQIDLYMETLGAGLQGVEYRGLGLRYVFDGADPEGATMDVISGVLEVQHEEHAATVLSWALSIAMARPEDFGPQARRRMWAALEPHVGSMPAVMREVVGDYEGWLRGGEAGAR